MVSTSRDTITAYFGLDLFLAVMKFIFSRDLIHEISVIYPDFMQTSIAIPKLFGWEV